MRLSRSRGLLLYAALLSTVSACRCKSDEAHPSRLAEAEPEPAPGPSPEPDLSRLLRCGDFLSAADVTALGLDASKYNPDHKTPNLGLGVDCNVGSITAAIFHGESFDTMREGARSGIAQGVLEKQDGPKIGRETIWTALQQADTVTFLSTNARYAANVAGAGTGTEILEKMARVIDANMSKR